MYYADARSFAFDLSIRSRLDTPMTARIFVYIFYAENAIGYSVKSAREGVAARRGCLASAGRRTTPVVLAKRLRMRAESRVAARLDGDT